MGEVLAIAVIIVLVIGGVYVGALLVQSARHEPQPTDSPVYRNHLGMARWIERSVGDDMIRVTIPEAEYREAQRLLEQFYGERREIGRGE